MPLITEEAPKPHTPPTLRDRAMDAARHVAHTSHEARLLKSIAADSIEDGVHAAKRAMKSAARGLEQLEDFRDETAHRIKQQPFRAIGIAAICGVLVGAGIGWFGARYSRRS